MLTVIIISWLSILTGCMVIFGKKYSKLKQNVKYLLPFVQDKTLKALTSYIENDKESELLFDENGELLEKKNETETGIENENLYNKNFNPLPEDCKAKSLEEAIENKLVHKIAKYRLSIDREKIITCPNKVCLFWKPGTIFAEYGVNITQIFILRDNNLKPLFLHSTIGEERINQEAGNSFENFVSKEIELLALPEEYLK